MRTPLKLFGLFALTTGAVVACKREAAPEIVTHTTTRPIAAPTTQDVSREIRLKDLQELRAVPEFGGAAINTRGEDGEVWAKYPDGFMYQEIVRKEGREPGWGQTVSVNYVGRLPGKEKPFDASKPGHPLVFRMGSKDLIPGFSMAINGMRVGSKRRVWIPPEFAYGEAGRPDGGIPPNSPLIFEIELVSITGSVVEPPKEGEPGYVAPKAAETEPGGGGGTPGQMGPPAPSTMPGQQGA